MVKSHGRMGRPWRRLRTEILAQSDICYLCGKPGADTVDHVVPLSVAPERAHDKTNLAPAHRSCNSKKGNRWSVVSGSASRRW
jgi:5-methylcytosine-specific restriction endonuclease McrA